ncbi:hypothetical protein GMRT_12514 [Giardia muris]|uniref:Uncharacterized protein n=1 Tax=Giardia muris TaxID=5742 RepID=A0A4Z1SR72_GIAMU|nr:hypothetical protein GMRT_12514 [Giardia muris]|eukprot:TNJ28382.1 hypothetical protein GMRT_12514 [Giardia muris]
MRRRHIDLSGRLGTLFRVANTPLSLTTIQKNLGCEAEDLRRTIRSLKRSGLLAEERVSELVILYPLVPLFGSKRFQLRSNLVTLHLQLQERERDQATPEQLARLSRLQRQTTENTADGELQAWITCLNELVTALSNECGLTRETVLAQVGISQALLDRFQE